MVLDHFYVLLHPRHSPSEGRQQVSKGRGETRMPLRSDENT